MQEEHFAFFIGRTCVLPVLLAQWLISVSALLSETFTFLTVYLKQNESKLC